VSEVKLFLFQQFIAEAPKAPLASVTGTPEPPVQDLVTDALAESKEACDEAVKQGQRLKEKVLHVQVLSG
jgi:hypothetical protein